MVLLLGEASCWAKKDLLRGVLGEVPDTGSVFDCLLEPTLRIGDGDGDKAPIESGTCLACGLVPSLFDLGPFLANPPRPPTLNPGLVYVVSCSASFSLWRLEGSCDLLVAAVEVSMGGGRMGAACTEEVEEHVVVERDEDEEWFLVMVGAMRWE